MTRPDDPFILSRLATVIERRKKSDPDLSYVARLFSKGEDAILKKIGEEATEVVMAAKDLSYRREQSPPELALKLVGEVADLWFHCMVMLSYFDLNPAEVLAELERRERKEQ